MSSKNQFKITAKNAGLSLYELSILSICQSEIYHLIRFGVAPDSPDTPFMLAKPTSAIRRALNTLHEAGFISLDARSHVRVTAEGWNIPCNGGASIFIGPPEVEEIFAHEVIPPKTRFGPRLPAACERNMQ